MALKITRADASHYQYFKPEILAQGAGYIVSNANSIVGLFSFLPEGNKAELNFTFVFDNEAIKLAVQTFLEDHPKIETIQYMGNQNLTKVGFKQKVYKRS
ncbi:hypothetical protein [Beduini massiliensis]|uniref:hypothetical protein n=1 Tax=Beduini massiliensis TaxID=1585974 RepID=UPI00059A9489|nr:hypothetical protein [Beduini massiliensis]